MNGILTITDGTAILEDGKLECENINVKTATITTLKDSDLVNCTTSTIASVDNDLVNKKYVVDNFVDRTNNLSQSINGLKTFTNNVEIFNATLPSLILATSASANTRSIIRQTATSLSINNQNPASSIVFQINGSTCTTINNSQLLLPSNIFLTTNDIKSRAPTTSHTLLSDITTGTLTISSSTASNTLNGATQINQQSTFNNFTPICSVATPSAINHLTRKDYVDNNFVDKTNPQTIGGIKTFSVFPEVTATTPTLANQLIRKDYVDNNFVDKTNPQTIGGIKTFSVFPEVTATTPTLANQLIRKDYVDNNFVNLSSNQSIYGVKTFGNRVNCNGTTSLVVAGLSTFAGTTDFNAQVYFVNLTPICYINPTDPNHLTRKAYVDNNFVDRTNTLTQSINGLKTFSNDLTCSTSLISNNITAPVVLGGTNNIFTNLDTFTGGAIINIGAKSNNINIKCNLNIVESVYNSPTKITTINQEGDSCRFTNNGSTNGDYIFTIVESGTFNTFVINKTSVEIAGDAVVSGNLILYDINPSTLSMSIGVLGNNMTFDPQNTENTTYNFKVNDSIGVTSTQLIISTDLTTINNDLTHKQTQMLNKVKIISGTSTTLSLPLEQTIMLTSTGVTNINITLPELNESYHAGFSFNIIKSGSITNSVIFTASGSNLLRTNGDITGSTSLTLMVNTSTIINMYSLEITSGNFEWVLY